MSKFVIVNPKQLNVDEVFPPIEDTSVGGYGKKNRCSECEEGYLEFIGCDDNSSISEMMYECNICHMPIIIKLNKDQSTFTLEENPRVQW
jgi:hypothetical protein